MQVGINYAWKNYGWDFGPPPMKDDGTPWGRRAAWGDVIDADLVGFRRLGLQAVRWFILGDGITYGVGEERPRVDAEGLWRMGEPPPLTPEFEEDFRFLLERCHAAGIQLVPSLVDFHFCFPGVVLPGTSRYIKGGRGGLLEEPARRRLFLDRVLGPLLGLSAAYRDVIYAWELMNEPEWCTRPPGVSPQLFELQRTVVRDDMRNFLREGVGRINAAGFRSTVGFAHYDTLKEWDSVGLGITLHQFHWYGGYRRLPRHVYHPGWPAIVGEIATATHRPWAELDQAQDIESRLRLIERRGYPAVFLWSANRKEEVVDPKKPKSPEGPVVDWSEENRRRVARYTGSF
jgi:hypothetical protein